MVTSLESDDSSIAKLKKYLHPLTLEDNPSEYTYQWNQLIDFYRCYNQIEANCIKLLHDVSNLEKLLNCLKK
ncbi:MAG: hypothetical protein BGO10_03800 [Chlamydia sp. 32-24]|nr:MAG: hypothetical protein BGO10_03800 [Chlamydia sp. 32-24]